MQFKEKIVFITGANRGIGKVLVEACLAKGVRKVYAASRKIENIPAFNDPRVAPVLLDISNDEQIKLALDKCADTQKSPKDLEELSKKMYFGI
ncbi:SDR family NAD(P)-dependent oxidoreductase [Bdellovibrio sp. BCCA]|uniref:SDR family NAD(P)-dependent oxidoreductase n=1 Tax=Bdellovibrio sp. BCCA TaxID=3136281 RepID=UPI0030EFBD7A